jgi:hypothetical protein
MMRHLLFRAAVWLAGGWLLAPVADCQAAIDVHAFIQTVINGQNTNNYQKVRLLNDSPPTYGHADTGGEFRVQLLVGSTWEDVVNGPFYLTVFCLERGEFVTPAFETYYATIEPNALYGTNPYTYPAGDPINYATAVLYGLYQDRLLDDYATNLDDPGTPAVESLNFTYNNDDWVNAVQDIIWKEEENGAYSLRNDPYSRALNAWLMANYTNPAFAHYPSLALALNLWGLSLFNGDPRFPMNARQSQILYDPGVIPEPSTLSVLGLAAVGWAGWAVRRRRAVLPRAL